MIEILEKNHGSNVAIRMSGELTTRDYDPIVALLENKIRDYGKINLYCEIEDMEKVEPGAIWKDLKFDVKHFNDFKKVALVGDKQWLEWGAKFARPFTSAEVKYFDKSERSQAMDWVLSGKHVY